MIDPTWPAAIFGIAGAWLVSGTDTKARGYGFLLWIVSNGFWIAHGGMTGTWALVGQNTYFLITSIRGWWNNRVTAPVTPTNTSTPPQP